MTEPSRFFLTTAIDYPNSRPHIGTAFEKLGADVQARYRRMEGYEVFFLMGNDENTVKVAKRAAELGLEPKAYCDDMARQFQEVWRALEISYDDFIQTSEAAPPRGLPQVHPEGLRQRPHLQGQLRGLVLRGLRKSSRPTRRSRRPAASVPITKSRRSAAASRATSSRCRSFRSGCCSSTRRIPTSSSRRPAATRSSAWCRRELKDINITRTRRGVGHPRARSTRSSPSTSGSTPC